jgi:TRAP-type uncharacterized transport system fused permease subunit
MLRRTTALERVMLIGAGLLLVYPAAAADAVGVAIVLAAVLLQRFRRVPA